MDEKPQARTNTKSLVLECVTEPCGTPRKLGDAEDGKPLRLCTASSEGRRPVPACISGGSRSCILFEGPLRKKFWNCVARL